MAKKQRQLDRELDALVREHCWEDELVLGWTEFHPGEITVRLINRELHSICKPSGRGAGKGRTLSFKMQDDGRWRFRGVGGWIS